MSERDDLLLSVADEIKTYRKGELPEPTPEHVDRWLSQFTPSQQLPFLREFDHVIRQTFINRKNVKDFLRNLLTNEDLAGNDPTEYWGSANFLNIQQNGQSQNEMIKLFSICLEDECDLEFDDCGDEDGDYIYLDDVMFSGNRIGNDLEKWIETQAPKRAKIHVIVAAWHTLGRYFIEKRFDEVIAKSGKNISITYWHSLEVENQRANKNSSGVLWPTVVPNAPEVEAYMALPSKYPFDPRRPSARAIEPFSSEAGRQVLESEFFIAGAKIIAKIGNPKPMMRPLGFSPFGVGFGSLLATYRNCPNNCPLAMWWGNPKETSGALHWYPLLQRETYASARNVFS